MGLQSTVTRSSAPAAVKHSCLWRSTGLNQTDVLPSSCVALLWRLDTVATSPAEQNGGSIVGTAMLMALLLAFAPVALLGGPSTSLMLCLAAVAVLAAVARWELIVPRGAFSTSAVFGVGCGLLAMIDTVTLITRKLTL